MEACLIVTYRCNAKCYMCHTRQHPSKKDEEFKPVLVSDIPANKEVELPAERYYRCGDVGELKEKEQFRD